MKINILNTSLLLLTTLASQTLPLFLTPHNSQTLAQVASPFCANPGRDTTPLDGIVNTYYPATSSAGAGSTTINLGARRGANIDIQPGDLVVVMQMQGVNAGNYEYAVAEQFNGSSVTLRGTGTNGGLNNSYLSSPATTTQGQQTFQVIRVPQYADAAITGTVTAAPWDGSSGGVVIADVAGQLNFTGNVNVSGQGFRGGRGLRLGSRIDVRVNPPQPIDPLPPGVESDYTGLNAPSPSLADANAGIGASSENGIGANGSKGEGTAGTPRYTFNGNLTAPLPIAQPPEGYPNGSFGRGAIGNAGGGATDGDPFGTNPATLPISQATNAENAGGGGGANAGTGGQGGFAWRSIDDVGGRGGNIFPAASDRIILGGGGGAGSNNDGALVPGATARNGIGSSGAAGGGIVLIRAGNVIGNGAINVAGANAPGSQLETATTINFNDGAGGGGAGGSVVISALNNSASNLNINAQGGEGGDVRTAIPHGPGGGGGGGVVLTRNVGQTSNVQGGNSGTFINTGDDPSTEPPNIIGDQGTYGAANGSQGIAGSVGNITGILSGAECLQQPQPILNKSVRLLNDNDNSGSITVGDDLQYVLTITNPSTTLPINNIAIADRVPTQLQVIRNSLQFPSGFTAASTLPTNDFNGTGQYISFTNPGNLAINSTVNLTYTARILPGATGQIENQAGIDLTPTDTNTTPEVLSDASDSLNPTQPGSGNNPGNPIDNNGNINQVTGDGINPDVTAVNIQPTPQPRPIIFKSVRLLNDNDNSGSISVGDDLQYVLTITNPDTNLPINNIAIADRVPTQLQVIRTSLQLPSGFSAASSLPANDFNGTGQYISFTNPGNLAINSTVNLTYTARILPGATGQIENQAGIDLTPTDTNTTPEVLSDASDSLNPNQAGSGVNPGNPIDGNGNINQVTGDGINPDITAVALQPIPATPPIINFYGVKRITNVRRSGVPITDINFNTFIDDPNDSNDNASGWSQFLPLGVPNIPSDLPLSSGDEVEYTIYYLVEGNQAIANAGFCDPIPRGTSFIPNSFGSGRGISVNIANTISNPTNLSDGDNGSFLNPVAPLPTGNVCPNQTNPTGAVIVNLGNLDFNPGNNFGFVRFWVRVE